MLFQARVFLLSLVMMGLAATTFAAGSPTLTANKTTFAPGEKMTVTFTTPSAYESQAWIGIIPSDVPHGKEEVNDAHDITYQYLNKRARGTLTFTAPNKPGNYDLRMNDSDNNGKEVASVSFSVEGASAEATGKPTITTNKQSYKTGESITVTFNAPGVFEPSAWIGIVPSNIQHGNESVNDENDVSYQYLNKRARGTLTFKAPDRAGKYDLRMNDSDSNGKEVASVTITVK